MKKVIILCIASVLALALLVGCNGQKDNDGTIEPQKPLINDGRSAGKPAQKPVVNFEGIVTAVDGDEVTLENGKIVVISADTVFAGDPDTNNAVSEDIAVGSFIQGYTEDEPTGSKITAAQVYTNADQ